MEAAADLAARLTQASRRKLWNVYERFAWPAKLDEAKWCMPPELISIYGTAAWHKLDERQQRALSLYEIGNFFSLVLQGERPLVQGLGIRLYTKETHGAITDYLHHFIDEENKHMVMFAEFCARYLGKVYPEKKVVLPRQYDKGEEDLAFYCKVMVVEEIGDYYNVTIARDERVDPLVRELNQVHHVDEARHLAFGRRYVAELAARYLPGWSRETRAGFQTWLAQYLKSSWGDFYNPTMYKDAGLADAYELRQLALASTACAEHRRRASRKLVDYFLEHGLLAEEPAL
jgi:hypothetical protein